MKKYCVKCKTEYDENATKCPKCGKRLKKQYTQEELKKIQKENEDIITITTMLW